ncbi:MAG: hypothetical protein ACTIN8_06690 [Pseudolactococcus laudensis]
MKNLFKGIRNFFSGKSAHQKQDYTKIDLEVLANLELAHSFNHAVYLHFNEKMVTLLVSLAASRVSLSDKLS